VRPTASHVVYGQPFKRAALGDKIENAAKKACGKGKGKARTRQRQAPLLCVARVGSA